MNLIYHCCIKKKNNFRPKLNIKSTNTFFNLKKIFGGVAAHSRYSDRSKKFNELTKIENLKIGYISCVHSQIAISQVNDRTDRNSAVLSFTKMNLLKIVVQIVFCIYITVLIRYQSVQR